MGIGYLGQQFRFDPAGWRVSVADTWRGAPAIWVVSGVVSGVIALDVSCALVGSWSSLLDVEMGCDVIYQPSTRNRKPH